MSANLGLLNRADGSARFSFGKSSTVASVYGPKEVRMRDELLNKAFVDVSFKPLIGYSGTAEKFYERVLKNILEDLIITTGHPRTAIEITIQVMGDDGAILATAINAAFLALMDAGVPLRAMAAASTSATLDDGSLVLDSTKEEMKVHFR
ncbi:Exosome component 5 [Irineochytrium annulatum]|nr:Exosome component 5 [Irineochytrium annulatum]